MRPRADGMLIFDDDMSRLTDMMLNAGGVRNTYISGSHRTWIRKIGDESLREGMGNLSDRQITMIEALAFDGKSPLDVRKEMGISAKEIRAEVRRIRRILLDAM